MEKYFEILKKVDLFHGIDESELRALLSCLSAKMVHYEKNQMVFLSGEPISSFGIVLSGQVQVFQDDYYGNRSILAGIVPCNLLGESFAFAETKALPVSVIATTESELLFIDCHRIESSCSNACGFHSRLIHNMLNSIAKKNVALTQKLSSLQSAQPAKNFWHIYRQRRKSTKATAFVFHLIVKSLRIFFPSTAVPYRMNSAS